MMINSSHILKGHHMKKKKRSRQIISKLKVERADFSSISVSNFNRLWKGDPNDTGVIMGSI